MNTKLFLILYVGIAYGSPARIDIDDESDRWTEVERQSRVAMETFKHGYEIAKKTYNIETVLKHASPERKWVIEQKYSKQQVLAALEQAQFGLNRNHTLLSKRELLSPARRLELIGKYEQQLQKLFSNGNYYAEALRMVGCSWFYSSKVKTK